MSLFINQMNGPEFRFRIRGWIRDMREGVFPASECML